MMDVIVESYDLDRSRTVMVGDRLNTDIMFGKMGGLQSLLVLTGVTSEETAIASETQPDYYLDSLSDLFETKLK
jgi:4-nitrophenyl phosphatase